MSIKTRNQYLYSAEPEDIRAWRRYAQPFNDRVAKRGVHYHATELSGGLPIKPKRIKVKLI